VRRAQRSILPVVVATAALVVLLAIRPLSTAWALAIWFVLAAAIAMFLLVRRSREGRGESGFEAALRVPDEKAPQPVELLRTERDLELGIAGAGHAHHRLLPILREAAAARLASRHGVELELRPDAARELLGEDVWELLRPDRPEPEDRFARGVPRERVAAIIERVESL
jgi:hypothetical protein